MIITTLTIFTMLNMYLSLFTLFSLFVSLSVEGGLLTDGPFTVPAFGPFPQQEEIEPRLLELEQDPPNWRELAPSENLKKLSKKEIKRQEVINGNKSKNFGKKKKIKAHIQMPYWFVGSAM